MIAYPSKQERGGTTDCGELAEGRATSNQSQPTHATGAVGVGSDGRDGGVGFDDRPEGEITKMGDKKEMRKRGDHKTS